MSALPTPSPAPHPPTGLDARVVESSFADLPPAFYTRVRPTPLPDPYPVAVSAPAAALLGLDPEELRTPVAVAVLAGNRVLPGAAPLAAVYSGHQFGVWAGQLGDGRALLLGAVEHAGAHWELQLKGAGLTPYSRMGDGRAVLRSSIREFLCSEAMAGLGIPTTRALALVGSDAPVRRETIETAAVVTRMAPTFIRFGSFEHWAAADRPERLRLLADYTIARFYPELADAPKPHAALLEAVTRRTARLMAQWQAVGFCHGVMNTDNMSILGLTIDYGPFGFLDAFDAEHICNHSDHQGRYRYRLQPDIAHWNLYRLGQALMPLIEDVDTAGAALAPFKDEFTAAMLAGLRAKLGLAVEHADDTALIDDLFALLQSGRPDYTLFFRNLAGVHKADAAGDAPARDLFIDRAAFDAWAARYRTRLALEPRGDAARALAMNAVNPRYVLRNHLAETAIRQAQAGDFGEIARLAEILQRPFDEQPEHAAYAQLPPDWASGLEVSCSS